MTFDKVYGMMRQATDETKAYIHSVNNVKLGQKIEAPSVNRLKACMSELNNQL